MEFYSIAGRSPLSKSMVRESALARTGYRSLPLCSMMKFTILRSELAIEFLTSVAACQDFLALNVLIIDVLLEKYEYTQN
jgi:hypothetical protein